jgi:hypothetical protein
MGLAAARRETEGRPKCKVGFKARHTRLEPRHPVVRPWQLRGERFVSLEPSNNPGEVLASTGWDRTRGDT